jgi:predicted helicase
MYRPFIKTNLYYSRELIHRPGIFSNVFNEISQNIVLWIGGLGSSHAFCPFVSNSAPDLQGPAKVQCFPLYLYDEVTPTKTGDSNQSSLFDSEKSETQYQRRDAITDEGLQHFLDAYPGEQICKEDIFYYVYGLLHSQEYRDRYADNLSKELPRIPRVKTPEGFWGFSKAGRELADWHLNYETKEPYKATIEEKGDKSDKVAFYRVEKMKHPKVKNEEGKSVNDLTKVIYNSRITVSDIPVEAYDYVVNGKPAIEWVIERQCVKTDKASGIVNDANDWANETMNDPRYPLDLLLRVIRVSLETNRIVASLPALDID